MHTPEDRSVRGMRGLNHLTSPGLMISVPRTEFGIIPIGMYYFLVLEPNVRDFIVQYGAIAIVVKTQVHALSAKSQNRGAMAF